MDKFKDECGVFGIFGHPEAANMTYLGLYALQHRGQESAGIAASDGEQVRVSKAMGYVADTFDGEALSHLPGSMAIGHVRYSTAGESKLSNAQPILIECAHGQIAICHNGNLVNAGELRYELVRQGSIFQSSSDTEVILHLYARSKAPNPVDALVESVSQVQGAFSLALMTRDRMIAVRDPHGFRPLALGRLDNATVIASETCAMDLIGATYIRDIEPGEVLVVSAEGVRSIKPFPPAPLAHCVFEHVYFARPDSYVFGRSVNEIRTNLGRILASEQPVEADVDRAGSRLGCLRGDGLCGSGGHAAADGSDPQSLRRPHVHPAAGVDPPLRREGEAEPGPQHSRWQARRPRGRFDRARHDQPQDREDGARRRRQGSARPDQLPADDLSLLLRRRYAEPVGADCGDAHARGDHQVSRRRQRRLSEPRRVDDRGRLAARLVLQLVLHRGLSGAISAG